MVCPDENCRLFSPKFPQHRDSRIFVEHRQCFSRVAPQNPLVRFVELSEIVQQCRHTYPFDKLLFVTDAETRDLFGIGSSVFLHIRNVIEVALRRNPVTCTMRLRRFHLGTNQEGDTQDHRSSPLIR